MKRETQDHRLFGTECLSDPVDRAWSVTESGTKLVLRLRGPVLSTGDLSRALSVICSGPRVATTEIVLDFRRVTELLAPWTVHLALLLDLSRRQPLRIRGLRGQPLRVAWFYRHNVEVLNMVGSRKLLRLRKAA